MAKMEFFKKRAREILMDDEHEVLYEGNPMPIGAAYKNLKHQVKNPSTVSARLEKKPGYMKMTFSVGRQQPAGGMFLSLSRQNELQNKTRKT